MASRAQELCQSRPWQDVARPRAFLLVDARGSPAHIGAVLLMEGEPHAAQFVRAEILRVDRRRGMDALACPDRLMRQFKERADQQIQGPRRRARKLVPQLLAHAPEARRIRIARSGGGTLHLAEPA